MLKKKKKVGGVRYLTQFAKEFQKNIYFCFTDYAKPFDCVDHISFISRSALDRMQHLRAAL